MLGPVSIGDWIGDRFQVFDIHEGGMSQVFVVNDSLGVPGRKVVALKTLRPDLLRSRIRVRRFARECRLWVQLGEHPNIVQALSVEIIDKRPYAVLELIQGGDLYRWIGTRRLDLPQIVKFGVQFCKGMEHAMRQGLQCHRDIKPGNLLVTETGTLKITDFGLARACEELVAVRRELPDGSIPLDEPSAPQTISWTDPRDVAEPLEAVPNPWRGGGPTSSAVALEPGPEKPARGRSSSSETYDPRITRAGARLGTGAYMAPEQFQDPKSADFRADIYGFGIVLYEMITGVLPFNGKSPEALAHKHLLHPPRSVAPSIGGRYRKAGAAIDAVVQRCLRKEPEDRYRSFVELRAALKEVATRFPRW